MEIRKSTTDDVPAILEIFRAAKAYMAAHGNPTQWGGDYPGLPELLPDIAWGDSYVLTENGTVVGTFSFIIGDEPTYQVLLNGVARGPALRHHPPAGFGGQAPRRCRRCDHLVSGALREPAGRHPRRQQDHAAPAGRKRLYQVRHHPCGGWHAPHCLPENVPYPAFAPGLNRKNAPPHRKRWSGAVVI